MKLSLGEIVKGAPPAERKKAEIDISVAAGQEPGTVVLTLQEPDVVAMYQRHTDADILRRGRPLWPRPLCLTVALIALCHVSPSPADGEEPVGELYARLAGNTAIWSVIEPAFRDAFPNLNAGAADDAKND